ncbi:MAG: LPS export ABC transporter periplasmic protein LptC [Synechocystis sp.]|nr:LPS export ABC transporter periplasmic protein LptC [Synechocystis sp.]
MTSSNLFPASSIASGWAMITGGICIAALLTSCAPPDPMAQPQTTPTPEFSSQLTLQKATLEQANAKGQTLWKIQVEKGQYTPDRKNATLVDIKGDFYQDGKVVLKVKADQGEIVQDGKSLILKDNIVAIDPRNNAVLRAQEVEWLAEESVLIARNQLKGEHPELTVTAKEGRYDTKHQRLLLTGNIVAITENQQKDKPDKPKDPRRLELKTEAITWEINQDKIIGDRPLRLVRFQDKTATDEVKAGRAEVLLKKKLVHLSQLSEFKSLDPTLQIATDRLTWSYLDRYVATDSPIKVVDYGRNVTVQGNQGAVNLVANFAVLQKGTNAISETQQSQLYADQLAYSFGPQTLEATGNVIYEQQKGMKFNLTGDRAVGSLQNNSVVVTSNQPERVVTEIYPNSNR